MKDSTPLTPIDLISPAPLPMNNIEEFEKKYIKNELILSANEFDLYYGKEKEYKKDVVIKEYKSEIINRFKYNLEFFDLERNHFYNFNNNRFKYISKFINCYKSKEKVVFIFEKFTNTLRNEIAKKKKFNLEEIKYLLIKINEIIKYFERRKIEEVIFTPETIGTNFSS